MQSSDAKSTGLKHMVANVFSLGCFVANAAVNYMQLSAAPPASAIVCYAYCIWFFNYVICRF